MAYTEREPMSLEDQQAIIDGYDVAIGDKMEEDEPFLAEVMADEVTPGKFGGPQWHLAVIPLQFDLRGKTGMFHEYYPLSNTARSKMGMWRAAWVKNRIGPGGLRIGRGELVGTVCWWVKKDIRFGRNAQGEPIVAEGVLLPVRAATAEEAALQGTKVPGANATQDGEDKPAQSAPDLSWTEDQIQAVLTAIEGLMPGEVQRATLNRDGPAYRLPRELKNELLSGRGIRYLTDANRVKLIDGKYIDASRVKLVDGKYVMCDSEDDPTI